MNKRVLVNCRRDIESCIESEYFYKIGNYKQRLACYQNCLRILYMEELVDRGCYYGTAFKRAEKLAEYNVEQRKKLVDERR